MKKVVVLGAGRVGAIVRSPHGRVRGDGRRCVGRGARPPRRDAPRRHGSGGSLGPGRSRPGPRASGPRGRRGAGLHGVRDAASCPRGGQGRRRHLVLPRGPLRARRAGARERAHRPRRLRRRARVQQPDPRAAGSGAGLDRALRLHGRRAAGRAALALRVQGALLPDRCHRGVHPTRPFPSRRQGRRHAGAERDRAGRCPGRRHARGVQRQAAHAARCAPAARRRWSRRRSATPATPSGCACCARRASSTSSRSTSAARGPADRRRRRLLFDAWMLRPASRT